MGYLVTYPLSGALSIDRGEAFQNLNTGAALVFLRVISTCISTLGYSYNVIYLSDTPLVGFLYKCYRSNIAVPSAKSVVDQGKNYHPSIDNNSPVHRHGRRARSCREKAEDKKDDRAWVSPSRLNDLLTPVHLGPALKKPKTDSN